MKRTTIAPIAKALGYTKNPGKVAKEIAADTKGMSRDWTGAYDPKTGKFLAECPADCFWTSPPVVPHIMANGNSTALEIQMILDIPEEFYLAYHKAQFGYFEALELAD